jgi:hypothetical protein
LVELAEIAVVMTRLDQQLIRLPLRIKAGRADGLGAGPKRRI